MIDQRHGAARLMLGRRGGDVINQHVACLGNQAPGRQPRHCGLADTVATADGNDLAGYDLETGTGERRCLSLARGEPDLVEDQPCRRPLACRGRHSQGRVVRKIKDRSGDLLRYEYALDLIPGGYQAQQWLDHAPGQHGAAGYDTDRDLAVDRQNGRDRGRGDLGDDRNHRPEALCIVRKAHDVVSRAGGLFRQALEAPQDLLFRPQRLDGGNSVQRLDHEIPHPGLGDHSPGRGASELTSARDCRYAEDQKDRDGNGGDPAADGGEECEEDDDENQIDQHQWRGADAEFADCRHGL